MYLRRHRAQYDRRELLREFATHTRELEALGPLVTGDVPLILRADGASDIRAVLELAAEFRIDVAIAGGARSVARRTGARRGGRARPC